MFDILNFSGMVLCLSPYQHHEPINEGEEEYESVFVFLFLCFCVFCFCVFVFITGIMRRSTKEERRTRVRGIPIKV